MTECERSYFKGSAVPKKSGTALGQGLRQHSERGKGRPQWVVRNTRLSSKKAWQEMWELKIIEFICSLDILSLLVYCRLTAKSKPFFTFEFWEMCLFLIHIWSSEMIWLLSSGESSQWWDHHFIWRLRDTEKHLSINHPFL